MLSCQIPRLEAALADSPLSAPCPCGHHELVFYPGWFCDDSAACVFPDLLRDPDDEPDDHD